MYVAAFEASAKSPEAVHEVQEVNAQFVKFSVHNVVHQAFDTQSLMVLNTSEYQAAA